MTEAENTQTDDATDRVAELTDTWESSPLTEPEQATDPAAKSPADPGYAADNDAEDAGTATG